MFLFISSHIGALLFKIEAAVRFGYKQVTCTDKPYTWNNDFVQKIEGEFVKDIKFYDSKNKTKTIVKRKSKDPAENDQNAFLQELSKLPAL